MPKSTHRPACGRCPRRHRPRAAAGAPASAATADDTPGYSVQAITVDVKVGPDNEQNCRIDADLYLPDGASASRKVPAILTTHGFGGDKADSNQTAIGKGFVRQGYAVLSYSGLGFGKTNCKISSTTPTGTARPAARWSTCSPASAAT